MNEDKNAAFIAALPTGSTDGIQHITLITRIAFEPTQPQLTYDITYTYTRNEDGTFSCDWTTGNSHVVGAEDREPADTPLNDVVREYIESIGTPYDAQWGTMYSGTVVTHTRYDTNTTYEIYIAETEGGGEGDGEYCHIVFAIQKLGDGSNEQFVKVTGYYQSYCDTSWDDAYRIVRPTTKVISVYE